MRLWIVAAIIALPALAACSNDQPSTPAVQAPAAPAPAVPAPAAPTPAAALPAGAEPLIGTWAANLGSCGDAAAVTTITATSYASPAGKCDISLTASGDGFTTTCGNARLTLTPVFAPTGEGVNVVAGDAKRETILRCSR